MLYIRYLDIWSMKAKKLIPMVFVVMVASAAIWTISPYFTNSVIDEALPTAAANPPMEKEDMTSLSGKFIGVGDGIHDAQGKTFVLTLDDGSEFLRFEDFKATNGPDLYVYLATDEKASEFVNLGKLKANMGNQNYEIPDGVDLSKYDKVLIWCKAFSVLFGSAELA